MNEAGHDDIQEKLIHELQFDLSNLLYKPERNESSRSKIQKGIVDLIDATEYQLNEEFILEVVKLSDELNLDEIASAELLYTSSRNEGNLLGISPSEAAKVAYHSRRQFILQIITFILSKNVNTKTEKLLAEKITFEIILSCFKMIENELDDIRQFVDRSRLVGSVSSSNFFRSVTYRRDCLFKEHQLLGELLFSKSLSSVTHLTELNEFLNHISSFQPNDLLLVSYLPAIMRQLSHLERFPETEVKDLHKTFVNSTLSPSELADKPIKAFLIVVFLTSFIDWCKKESERTNTFDFTNSVEKPIIRLISIGALEQFLSLSAEISPLGETSDRRADLMYDFRSILQRHIPKLSPFRFLDVDTDATSQLKRAIQQQRLKGGLPIDESESDTIYLPTKSYEIDFQFGELCAACFNSFIHAFLTNAAFVLTHLRDMEEDLLLLSENFDLDVLTENADLERFYLAIYYIHRARPHFAAQFWEDKSSSLYGFLQWASHCNSPLIISTFCCVLAALSNNNENAINSFNFLQLTNSSTHDGSLRTSLSENPNAISSHFSCVSWSAIFSSLKFYSKSLSLELPKEIMDSSVEATNSTRLTKEISVSLGEDSQILLAGFFQLISDIARNSDMARIELYESDDCQLITFLSKFLEAEIPLVGPVLMVLSSMSGSKIPEKKRIWNILDSWIFSNNPKSNQSTSALKDSFLSHLKSLSQINAFTILVQKLLQPENVSERKFEPIDVSFPLDLGANYRKQGIWPYIEFLSTDIFVEATNRHKNDNFTSSLQLSILALWETCLVELNPQLVMNASACNLKDLDNIVACKSIIKFLQSHPGAAVLTFLYKMPVYQALFSIANLGIDKLGETSASSQETELISRALNVIDLLLERESFYKNELIPVLTLSDNEYYAASGIGTGGLQSFAEVLLLNLPLVANISLYVGFSRPDISRKSLSILKKVTAYSAAGSSSEIAASSGLLRKDKLLTMLETVDESIRVRFSFIEQLEAPIIDRQSIFLKIELLQFLDQNIPASKPGLRSITHFLLGFETRSMSLGSKLELGSIASEKSLLKSIIILLKSILSELCKVSNVEYLPIKLSALCLGVIFKLSKSLTNVHELLCFLRNIDGSNFFVDILSATKKISIETLWSGKTFRPEVNSSNSFVNQGDGWCTLTAFATYRSLVLRLLTLELRHSSLFGTSSLTQRYVNLLIDTKQHEVGSQRLFEFLDVLEFKPKNMIEKVNPAFEKFNFEYIIQMISMTSDESNCSGDSFGYDMTVIDRIADMVGTESQSLGLLSLTDSPENSSLFREEIFALKSIVSSSLSFDNFRFHQLQCLHSWTLLTQIIVNDGCLGEAVRINFIFEVFENIVPQIIDYLNLDIAYAQDLISLCVSLFRIYEIDIQRLTKSKREWEITALLDATRLFPVFKTAAIGIMSPQSTPTIRADLYVLANNYLQQSFSSRSVLTEIMVFIRSADQKLIRSICNDSLTSEGACKITSLLTLETLLRVSIHLQGSHLSGGFIIETVLENNYLLLLIQRIKSMDDIVSECLTGNAPRVSIDTLLYELTTFKTVFCLLTRIAQTTTGAKELLQCDIFKVISECSFLSEDPEVGLTLYLEGVRSENLNDNKPIELIFSIDSSLSSTNGRIDQLSLYDLYVPIFQVICSTIISLGPQNELCIRKAKGFADHFSKLIQTILKKDMSARRQRDSSISARQVKSDDREGFVDLIKLITLLDTLVNGI
ncbi:hypothetical protein OGAPHI_003582 [Ogataea philodendri]|uniref:Nucleoporin n=1 Tax=Ogataea philodendri TaxID=1378263 RepID=A0A9P8P4I2_9ASCO|nr:uncharacterized protein OGAPHI_003582 [Ogataea philodendri]KAH3665398.1 hypothetical protein OGAPHI_003582 [Ogataea philodendri]